VDRPDCWLWLPDPVHGFTVCGAYNLIISDSDDSYQVAMAPCVIRSQVIPLKVSMFVLRLLRNRLPAKTNLYSRGILQDDAQMCVVGCDQPKSAEHLFTRCSLVGSLWSDILGWIGFQIAHMGNVSDHFLQFETLARFLKSKRSLVTLIWCATSWTLWKERNNRIFQSKVSTVSKLIDNLSFFLFSG